MAKNTNISGVGGWLSLLIIGLTILAPLIGVGGFLSDFRKIEREFPQLSNNNQWQIYMQIVFWICLASTIVTSDILTSTPHDQDDFLHLGVKNILYNNMLRFI